MAGTLAGCPNGARLWSHAEGSQNLISPFSAYMVSVHFFLFVFVEWGAISCRSVLVPLSH